MLTLIIEPDAGGGTAPPGREVNTWADEAGRVFARAFVDADRRWIDWQGLGRFTFAPGSTDVRLRPIPGTSATVIRAMFDRVIQPVILQALGWQALHASGVAGPHGAFVFCGLGRSGKSTLAYAVGQRDGYSQIADDAIVIGEDEGQVQVHPLPFATGLRQDVRDTLRPVGPLGAEGPLGPSGSMGLRTVVGQTFRSAGSVPLHAVFILSQDAAAPSAGSALRVEPAEAFPLLLTHAHCFDESDAASMRRMVETYLALAGAVPVYALTYRPDFASLDTLVDTVMDIGHRTSGIGHRTSDIECT